jgi:hypothetical protein
LISAGIIEGDWIGLVKQWISAKHLLGQHQRHQVAAVSESSLSEKIPSIATISNDDLTAKTVNKVEIEPMGGFVASPIQEQPKRDAFSFTTDAATSASESSNHFTVSSNDSKETIPRQSHGSEVTSTRPSHVKVADQTPARKHPKPKKSRKNLLLFWKKSKQDDEETHKNPPIPPWSHFALKDNRRQFVEDYGDDIGEGLEL